MPAAKTKGTGKKKSRQAPQTAAAAPPRDWRAWRIGACLAFVVIVVYWRTLGNLFINFDDGAYIFNNDHVKAGLTLEGLRWAFTSSGGFYWQPLTWLSHMLDVEMFGLNPGGHHLVNILWHAASSALLVIVLWRMTGHLWRSAFAGALFALHPLRVESVAWAAERKDVLSTFFFLCTLWAYVWYTERPDSRRRYAAVAGAMALGLMAKPSVVSAPFALLLLDYWPLARKERWTALVREKLPFFGLAAAVSVATYVGQKQAGAIGAVENPAPTGALGNVALSYAHFLWKILWPHPLAIVYPYPRSIAAMTIVLCCLLLAAITGVVVWFGRKARYLPFGWFWYLGTLAPMTGIVQVGIQAYPDRFSYIPSIGIFVAVVWLAADVFERRKWRLAAPVAAATVLPVLAFATWSQLPNWRDDETVWRHAVDSTSGNMPALYNLGKDFADAGRTKEAVPLLKEAMRLDPDFYPVYYELGKAQVGEGDAASAIRNFSEAVRRKPDYAEAYYGRATTYMKTGDTEAAESDLRKTLEGGSTDQWAADAHNSLGVILAQTGNLSGATEQFRQAVLVRPDLVEAQENLAKGLAAQGRVREAVAGLQRALTATRGNSEIRKMLDSFQVQR
jgi:tetratricopeptide (TPR) repeat protein